MGGQEAPLNGRKLWAAPEGVRTGGLGARYSFIFVDVNRVFKVSFVNSSVLACSSSCSCLFFILIHSSVEHFSNFLNFEASMEKINNN